MEELRAFSGPAPIVYRIEVDGRDTQVEVHSDGSLRMDGRMVMVDVAEREDLSVYSVLMDGASHEVYVERDNGTYLALVRSRVHRIRVVEDHGSRPADPPMDLDSEIQVRAPLCGLVVDVPVSEGESVAAGQTLVVVESMKMENHIHAELGGRVSQIGVRAGTVVRDKDIMTVLKPSSPDTCSPEKGDHSTCSE